MTIINTNTTYNANTTLASPVEISLGITATVADSFTVTISEVAQSTGNETLRIVETADVKVIDFLERVATGTNRLAVIKNGVLSLIGKTQTSTPVATIHEDEILKHQIGIAAPIKSVLSRFKLFIPYPDRVKLLEEEREIRVEKQNYGKEITLEAMSTIEAEQRNLLLQVSESLLKPTFSATVSGIREYEIGDRVLYELPTERLEVIQTVFGTTWDFRQNTTTLSGSGAITHGIGL